MSDTWIQKRHPKKSAFSCETCRRRKVKCDAGHPICNRCKVREDTCVYKLSPTLSYTQRLEQQVERLEDELANARNPTHQPIRNEAVEVQTTTGELQVSSRVSGTPRLDEDERLPFHEPISLFQLSSSTRTHENEDTLGDQEIAVKKANLVNNAWIERAYEKLADTPEPFRSLIDSHFCWIQPLFNFVYRPAFTRDMKTGGPYFSQALLNAVLSHSVRWCRSDPGMCHLLAPFNYGADFSKNAICQVFEDVQNGNSKIPTIQTLLLLSAQECGLGHRTQAWLYSGMAFRLIDDMGICVDGKKYTDADQLSTEDIEIRNRLFWSCYFWDKLISLYFGRSPMIQQSDISPPRVLMDDTAELEAWTPHGLLSPNYPPRQAHSISCFIQMCALAEILNEILIHLYSPSRDLSLARAHQCALGEGTKLRDWWRDLPEHLKINLASPQLDCPPSHIVTLNCLYHSINILLNRAKLKLSREPELTSAMAEHNPLIQCISSATAIVALFDLYKRTFGGGHVVLSLAYSVYIAASIFLIEIQATGHAAALERLSLCVGALQRLQETNPVIATASDLIAKELDALGIRLPDTILNESSNQVNQQVTARPLLPLPMDACSTSDLPNNNSGCPVDEPRDTLFLDLSYFNGQVESSMGYDVLDISPEMYETFLHIDPISVTMNPGFDLN